MRKPFVAGNWKMNKTAAQAFSFIQEILPGLKAVSAVEKVLCPPFTALPITAELLKETGIGLGAQNMYWKESGAFTGECSPQMVKEFCQYVIIGHSERRAYFGETDETVNQKVQAALAHDLIPIVCIGETLEENEAGKTTEIVTRQVTEGLKGFSTEQAEKIVIAYEPVWAIGTGRAASGAGANLVVSVMIRPAIESLFGETIAQSTRVLYGGSVTPSNAAEFFSQPDIDGALVGGASLKNDFVQIVQAAAK